MSDLLCFVRTNDVLCLFAVLFSLARQMQKEIHTTSSTDFTEEQKVILLIYCKFMQRSYPFLQLKTTFLFSVQKTLGKIATCLEMRSASLQVCVTFIVFVFVCVRADIKKVHLDVTFGCICVSFVVRLHL